MTVLTPDPDTPHMAGPEFNDNASVVLPRSSIPLSTSPLGLKWRSSYWFTTFVVSFGIATDLLVYTVIIPVMPFQLQKLGHSRVSALTGWLLFAFSVGLVLSTIPIAVFSERYDTRRAPLIAGLVSLIASQIMLMEAPTYPVMCIARILQGVSSSMVWVVGLALLCDATPESSVGRQLGIAMGGVSIGTLIGPPVGGALYSRFGYRGPFVFGIVATVLDLVARLLVIEREYALKWGVDPKNPPPGEETVLTDVEKSALTAVLQASDSEESNPTSHISKTSQDLPPLQQPPRISLPTVIIRLGRSPRASAAFIVIFVYGFVYTSQEPTLPLHLQDVWGLDPAKVGLIFLAAVIPTLFSSPAFGWLSDKKGIEWVAFACLILAVPWWVVVIIQGPLAFFTVAYAVETFFTSGVVSLLAAELASISRDIEGVGYAHVYGAFNIAYGIGSAAGPIIGGQIYDNVKRGWMALCLLDAGLLIVSLSLTFSYTGADPLLRRLKRSLKPGTQAETAPD